MGAADKLKRETSRVKDTVGSGGCLGVDGWVSIVLAAVYLQFVNQQQRNPGVMSHSTGLLHTNTPQ